MVISNLAIALESATAALQNDVPKSCEPRHSIVELALSMVICLGLILSYLPQIVRIIVKRSSVGFSPWFLFLGATGSASSFLNVLSLQWAVVSCCQWLSTGACAESLLGIVQVALQWFMFMTVALLFIIYYPKEMRYERAIVLQGEQQALLANARRLGDDEESGDGDEDDSSNGDLDSMDSHIAAHYGQEDGVEGLADNSALDAGGAVSGLTAMTDGSGGGDSALASRLDVDGDDERSSSAFSRLVPTFWPVWKAPPKKYSPSPLGKVAATEPVPSSVLVPQLSSASATPATVSGSGTPDVVPPVDSSASAIRQRGGVRGGDAAHVRIAAPEVLRKPLRKRKVKTRSQEWGLALSLAWIVAIHFVFILLVTLLLVSSLPSTAFPPPPEDVTYVAPSSRLLVDRWAAILGWSAMILAALQYLPQIVYTARMKLVGSLSIPMMCLQVPGSVVFVYSLAMRPGVNITSLAAYICTGVLQAVLLALCVTWHIRQKRLGIDDYGRPLAS